MKSHTLFFLILLIPAISAGQNELYWQPVDAPEAGNFTAVHIFQDLSGIICSDNGSILIYDDINDEWQVQTWPGYHFTSLSFTDQQNGWCAGWYNFGAGIDSSLILRTTDGGLNWTSQEHENIYRINDIQFINPNEGWAVGFEGSDTLNAVLHTTDGGNTWEAQAGILVANAALNSVSFRSETIGQVCGNDGAFFLTVNGGNNWAMNFSFQLITLNDIVNWGILSGMVAADDGYLFYTTSNWYQYTEVETNTMVDLNAACISPEENVYYVAGDEGTILYSSNLLLGFIQSVQTTSNNLNDITLLTEEYGWAVGDNSTLLIGTPIIGVNESLNRSILRVYPNPANGFAHIYVLDNRFPEGLNYSLTTIGGYSVQYGTLKPGKNLINIKSLSPGIYILEAYSGSYRIFEKLIIR